MSNDAAELFFDSATQYYVAGRFAALAGLVPVVGNLLHHAAEMYLKGVLSKTRSLAQLKQLGHGLPAIWAEAKRMVKDPALDRFDSVVAALHAFEDLRYPESVLTKGMSCTVSITRPSVPVGSAGSEPKYDLCLADIDELVGTAFGLASMNPKFFLGRLKNEARQFLVEANSVSGLTTG